MKRFGHIVAAVAAWISQSAAAETLSPEQGWAEMTKCAALADGHARHVCSDDVLRRAGLLVQSSAPSGVAAAASSAAATTSPPSAPAAVPSDYGLQRPKDAPPPKKEEPVDVTLAKIEKGLDGKLVLTTTDGAIWRQTESQDILPLPESGRTMTISRTAFGGFKCKPADRIAFRCLRSR